MKKFLFLFITTLLLLSSCKSKKVVAVNEVAISNYSKAKTALSSGEIDLGMDLIEKAINENNPTELEELYYLKGFILQANGKTQDSREYYQKVLDLNNSYSSYSKKAQILIQLTYEEEAYENLMKQKDKKENTNTEETLDMEKFEVIEKQPRFESCPDTTNAEIQQCTNRKIQKHISRNYDSSIGEQFGVHSKTRTYVFYSINKEGIIINLRTRGANKFLALEAKRVVYSIPKMIPGYQQGEPVEVPYSLPVTYAPY
ncbi:hypothetical protein [Nonlabens sp.]|uniref:tetratricopeptide repeat protein n=1 Tax=Nonlabens sp. TaxID=1888209 RepID=UPI003265907C